MNAKLQILDMAERLATTNSRSVERVLVMKMTLALWRVLPVEKRRDFLRRTECGYPYEFIEWHKRFPDIDDPELENVARNWGMIQPTLYDDDANFGRSFEKLIRFRRTPSEKQIAWAKRLYADWKAYRVDDETPDEIEVTE